jgi:hypothetical protein
MPTWMERVSDKQTGSITIGLTASCSDRARPQQFWHQHAGGGHRV